MGCGRYTTATDQANHRRVRLMNYLLGDIRQFRNRKIKDVMCLLRPLSCLELREQGEQGYEEYWE